MRASDSDCQRSRAVARPTISATGGVPGLLPALLAAAEEGRGDRHVAADEQDARPPPGRGTCRRSPRAWPRRARGNRPGCGRRPARRRYGPEPPCGPRPRRPAGSRRSRCWRASGRRAACRGGSLRGRRRDRPEPSASTSGRVTSQPSSSSRATGPGDGRVLDRAGDEMARPRSGEAEDGEVVGLGPARGEDDLVGMRPEDVRDGLARPVEPATGGAAEGVAALGVAAVEPERPHGVEDGAGRAGSSRSGRGRSGAWGEAVPAEAESHPPPYPPPQGGRVRISAPTEEENPPPLWGRVGWGVLASDELSRSTASRRAARRRTAGCRGSPAGRPRGRRRRPSSRSRRRAR